MTCVCVCVRACVRACVCLCVCIIMSTTCTHTKIDRCNTILKQCHSATPPLHH